MNNTLIRGTAAALIAATLTGCAYPVYRERPVYRPAPVAVQPPPPPAPVYPPAPAYPQAPGAPIYDPGPGYNNAPAPQAQAPRSHKYGTVRAIDSTLPPEATTGGGALLGGLIGAVIGRQFGGPGGGRAAGTAIGAVGGAIVGNEVERQNNAAAGAGTYRVQVQLDNGAVRSFYFQDLGGIRVGDRVVVQGKNLQLM